MTTIQTTTVTTTSFSKESWQDKKTKLIAKFPQLKEIDLDFEEDKMEKMIDKLHSKIGKIVGKSKIGLIKFLDNL